MDQLKNAPRWLFHYNISLKIYFHFPVKRERERERKRAKFSKRGQQTCQIVIIHNKKAKFRYMLVLSQILTIAGVDTGELSFDKHRMFH